MRPEEEVLRYAKANLHNFPKTLVVLGSGWDKVLENAKVEQELDYGALFGVKTSVPGHEGKLVIATVKGRRVSFMSGRFHMYEGFCARESTLPIRILAKLGLKQLVLTAACGGLNPKFKVGDLVVFSDLLTLFLALDNPLVGPKFVDLSQAFNPKLRALAISACVAHQLPVHEGVYAYYHGPNYETPADKMALRILGADVVGMSTVAETLMARSLGIEVLGLGFVTNLAFVKHDHKQVVAEANKAGNEMRLLLQEILSKM